MSTDDAIRASDADREHAVGMLRDGYATGRLTLAEFDDRTTAALTSRTWGELRGLTRDLPAPGQRVLPPAAPRQALGRSERLPAAALADRGPGLTPILLIADIQVTAGSELAGRPVEDVHQTGQVRVIALQRPGTDRVDWSPGRRRLLAPQDRIYVLATRAGLSRVLARNQPARD